MASGSKIAKVNPAFNKRHLKEYLYYGIAAGTGYSLPVWYYLFEADYRKGWVVYCGSIVFMFIIMRYVISLTKRRTDYKSTWIMIMAGHMAVLSGIIVSVLICLALCFVYIPGFFTGASDSTFLQNARPEMNRHNSGTLLLIFFPATLLNFGVGGFMSIVISYALKMNQTKDRAAPL